MTDTEGPAPISVRYTRRAETAARAAKAAIEAIHPGGDGPVVRAAKVEAAGRIAAALILADHEDFDPAWRTET